MAYAKPPYPSYISMPSGTNSNSSPLGTSTAVSGTPDLAQHRLDTKEKGSAITSVSQLLASAHRFSEAQEDLHANERTLWNKERKQWQLERKHFMERIRELENTVANLLTGKPAPSTWGQHVGGRSDASKSTSTEQSGQAKQELPTGRPYWIGPESVATRTFPDEVPVQHTTKQRRHSIEGNKAPAGRNKSVEFDPATVATLSRHESLSGVSGESVHPDYSDINFKPSALPSDLRKAVEKVEARSSLDKSSDGTSDSKPQAVIRPKLLDVPTANMRSEELYSTDAGHTPLTRVMGDESALGGRTPVPQAQPQEPIEAQSPITAVRPPNERQDSYFANAQIDGSTESNGDRALQEPLGVTAEGGAADSDFLEKVNQKLERQISQQLDDAELSPPAPSSEKGHRRGVSEDSTDGGPKLKLKKSINFGAPFGQSEPVRK